MLLVHSMWTKPMLSGSVESVTRKVITNCWCYASSVAFAHKNKQPIKLFADAAGKQLLSFLPYDQVVEYQVPEDTPVSFWAAGKFKAYELMKKGEVHIDGDAFIQSENIIHILESALKEYRLITQCVEDGTNNFVESYDQINALLADFGIRYAGKKFNDFGGAYNTGLIGFGDIALRDRYCKSYWECINTIKNKKDLCLCMSAMKLSPDIVLEQQKLYEMVPLENAFTLLGSGTSSIDLSKVIGFQHLLGDAKWQLLDKVIGQLYLMDPEIFNATVKAVNKYTNNLKAIGNERKV